MKMKEITQTQYNWNIRLTIIFGIVMGIILTLAVIGDKEGFSIVRINVCMEECESVGVYKLEDRNELNISALQFEWAIRQLKLSSFAHADNIGEDYVQNTNITLIQFCSNCTFINITSVSLNDGTIVLANVAMVKEGTNYYYILDKKATKNIGTYTVEGVGDLNGVINLWQYRFKIEKGSGE